MDNDPDISSFEIKRLLKWIAEANSTTVGVSCREVKQFLGSQLEDASQEYDVKPILKNLLDKEQLVKVRSRYFTQIATTLPKKRVEELPETDENMRPKKKVAKEKSHELSSSEIKGLLEWIAKANSTTGGVLCTEVKEFLGNQQEDVSHKYDVKLILKNLLDNKQLVKVECRYFTQVASTLQKNRVKKLAPTIGNVGPQENKGSETNSAEIKRLLERPTALLKNGIQKLTPTVEKSTINNCPGQSQVNESDSSNVLDALYNIRMWSGTFCQYCVTPYRCNCWRKNYHQKIMVSSEALLAHHNTKIGKSKWDGTCCERCKAAFRCDCHYKCYSIKDAATQTDMSNGAVNSVQERMMSIYS